MTNLAARLKKIFKHSDKSKELIADLQKRIAQLNEQQEIDEGSLSRLTNVLPSYLDGNELSEWVNRVLTLLETIKFIPYKKDQKRSPAEIWQAVIESPIEAPFMLEPDAESIEKIRFFFDMVIREACKQLLENNGDINHEIIHFLMLKSLIDKHPHQVDKIKWALITTVSLNLIGFEVLKKVGEILGAQGIYVNEYESVIAKETIEQKKKRVSYFIFQAAFNNIIKDKSYCFQRVMQIIKERMELHAFAHRFIEDGNHDSKLVQQLHKLLNFNLPSSIHAFFSSFWDKSHHQAELILNYTSTHYPEIAEHIFNKMTDYIALGENQFFFAIRFLLDLKRHDLAYRALHPSLLQGHLAIKDFPQNIDEKKIRSSYRRMLKHKKESPTELLKIKTHRRYKSQ